mgnify:CR=1 FL=1
MKKYITFFLFLCGILLLFCGCGSGNGNTTPDDISGTWSGTANVDGNVLPIAISIKQSGETVSGNYITNFGDSIFSGTVEGNYSAGFSELTFKYSGYSIATASLTFNSDKGKGTIMLLLTNEAGTVSLTKE